VTCFVVADEADALNTGEGEDVGAAGGYAHRARRDLAIGPAEVAHHDEVAVAGICLGPQLDLLTVRLIDA
jgi:hypothetical protein